jgi:hypothetical protein
LDQHEVVTAGLPDRPEEGPGAEGLYPHQACDTVALITSIV